MDDLNVFSNIRGYASTCLSVWVTQTLCSGWAQIPSNSSALGKGPEAEMRASAVGSQKKGVDGLWKELRASFTVFTGKQKGTKGRLDVNLHNFLYIEIFFILFYFFYCRLHFWRLLSEGSRESTLPTWWKKWKCSSRTSTVVCCLRTTHCRGKPIRVIQKRDQSIPDWCRWRRQGGRRGQNLRRLRHTPGLPHERTHKQPFTIIKKNRRTVLLTMEIKHHTHTEALHTPRNEWSASHLKFSRASLLSTSSLLPAPGTVPSFSSLCQAPKGPKTGGALTVTLDRNS